MKEHALIYLGLGKKNKEKIDFILTQMNFNATYINDQYLDDTVINLFDKESNHNNCNQYLFDFILCKNVDHNNILAFYKQCNSEGVPFSHKAILTEHNQNWSLQSLLDEINKEHTFFIAWNKLYRLLKDANECNPKDYSEESFKPYQESFINAYMYTKQENPDKEVIDKLIENIINTKALLKKR